MISFSRCPCTRVCFFVFLSPFSVSASSHHRFFFFFTFSQFPGLCLIHFCGPSYLYAFKLETRNGQLRRGRTTQWGVGWKGVELVSEEEQTVQAVNLLVLVLTIFQIRPFTNDLFHLSRCVPCHFFSTRCNILSIRKKKILWPNFLIFYVSFSPVCVRVCMCMFRTFLFSSLWCFFPPLASLVAGYFISVYVYLEFNGC